MERAAAATFFRDGRMPPRSMHPRHQQHKPLRVEEGAAASRRRRSHRFGMEEVEPPHRGGR
jgi:hypothetical protein